MLHAKFQRRRFLIGITIYGHGGHLGHVTWIIYIHIGSPFLPIDASYKTWLSDWPSGFREDL